ncbi:MAG: FkbM family methyltransferase [Paraglaciecola sp.]
MKIVKQKSLARAVSYFLQRWVMRKEFLQARVDSLNAVFTVKTKDVVGRHIYKYLAHEPELSDWLVKNITPRKGDVFLDIGANIGWYSVLLSRLTQNENKIFAFEPDPLNSDLLRQNLETNKAKSVTVIQAAVAESTGKAKLYQYNSNNLGKHSMLASSGQNSVNVDTVGLDQFFSEMGLENCTVRLLKIDVEGYEYFSLKSGKEVLKRCEVILCEYSPDIMRNHQIAPEALLDLFLNAGLYPWHLNHGELNKYSKIDLLSMKGVVDVIWTREVN